MSNVFAIGDTVELTEDYDSYSAGTKATVTSASYGPENYTSWDDAEGNPYGCYGRRLKLVAPAFKKGDKVEVITTARSYKKGMVGVVEFVDASEPKLQVRYESMSGSLWTHTCDVKAVAEHAYKVGERVQITIPEGNDSAYGGRFFVTGLGTVEQAGFGRPWVLADTKHPSASHKAWYIDEAFLTPLVEEAPKPHRNFKVGDAVDINGSGYWDDSWGIVEEVHYTGRSHYTLRLKAIDPRNDIYKVGSTCGWSDHSLTLHAPNGDVKVGDTIESLVDIWGVVKVGTRMIVVQLNQDKGHVGARVEGSEDTFAWSMTSERYKIVPATPQKPKATPVTKDTKPQIGDTIVAFWDEEDVEVRKKGVVARIDVDGNYETVKGNCIDWDSELVPNTSNSVFIVERAPVAAPEPEPVKVDRYKEYTDAGVGSVAVGSNGLRYSKREGGTWMPHFTLGGGAMYTHKGRTVSGAFAGKSTPEWLVKL